MEQDERIRQYCHGKLSASARKILEAEMATDPQLAKAVQDYQNLQRAISAVEAAELKNRLQQLPTPPAKRLWQWWWIVIAAALLFLAGWYLSSKTNPTPQQLYASYFEPYPNLAQPIVRTSTQADSLSLAFNAYEQGEYASAQMLFQALLKRAEDPVQRFYLAMSMLNQGQYAQAQIELDTLADYDFRFRPQVYWYRSLLSLQAEDTETARIYLRQLQAEYPQYQHDAVQKMLQAIK